MYKDKIEKILPLIQKPARYTGGELNSVVKNKENVKLRYAFCFPDNYSSSQNPIQVRMYKNWLYG